MKRLAPWVLCSAVALPLCACVADSGFKVHGRVVDEHDELREGCTLDRLEENGRVADSHRIDGAFDSSFTVAPGRNRFHLRVRCEGLAESFTSPLIAIAGTERYEHPIDLGTVRLTGRRID